MKCKGFTLVELITTFALTAVIIVILLNVIVVINNVYSKSNIKTELYINQSNLSNVLNSSFNSQSLYSYEKCDDTEFCYIFTYDDGTSKKLSVEEYEIKFGTFVYKLDEKSKIGDPSFSNTTLEISDITRNDSFLTITIPIISELYPNLDFGINMVYPYNSNELDLKEIEL